MTTVTRQARILAIGVRRYWLRFCITLLLAANLLIATALLTDGVRP